MRRHLTFRRVSPSAASEALLERRTVRLARHLPPHARETAFLSGVIEKYPTRELYRLRLSLELPPLPTLVADEEGHELEPTIGEAFDELERMVKKAKSRTRAEQFWKRKERREEEKLRHRLAEHLTERGREEELETIYDLLVQHLPRIQETVSRALLYREASGELFPGELDVDDVVDTVILRAVAEFDERPEELPLEQWLVALAVDVIRNETARIRDNHERAVSIETDVPETPPEQEVSLLGDEILDFYQPDEDLKVEDLLPDSGLVTPEDAAQARVLRAALQRTLCELPELWRESLILCALEGFTPEQAAKLIGRTPEEVASSIEKAREFLHAKIDPVLQKGSS